MHKAVLIGRKTDIEAMAQSLHRRGFKDEEIKLLPDPTQEQLSAELDEFAKGKGGYLHYCGPGVSELAQPSPNRPSILGPKDKPRSVSVTVSGPPGSGKTTICRLLAKSLSDHGIPCLVADDALGACREVPLEKCLEGLKQTGTRAFIETCNTTTRDKSQMILIVCNGKEFAIRNQPIVGHDLLKFLCVPASHDLWCGFRASGGSKDDQLITEKHDVHLRAGMVFYTVPKEI